MIRTKSEDAVSPVIGVMLLLVVTIVIAAVIAAFAGGLGTDIETKPVTAVDIVDISDGYSETVTTVKIPSKINGKKLEYGKTHFSYRGDDGWDYFFKIDPSKFVSERPIGEEGKDYLEYMYFSTKVYDVVTEYYPLDGGIDGIQSDVFFRERNTNTGEREAEAYGNENLQSEFLKITTNDDSTTERTVTLSCLHGDALDLSKISIKVTHIENGAEYILDMPRNSFTGTLSPGDTVKLQLTNHPTNPLMIHEGNIVSVVVYYGDYVIAEEEDMTVSHDYRG